MYLRYIEIQGFKSFADKTKLTFGREISAIVGPNGSGKSNISDAVRWVLGEQSSKSLRSGKMEDVIFGGTQLRKPMGYAQVTLCLDNSDGRVADVGDEVTVSRRYYRSGESEYLLNGNAVRLRDVREAFMDTGLSRDGYSIIEQGRISEVVAAKSTDRREIFEEASGIAKFRFRKNEAQRKLEQAEDNLSRLRDILDELEDRVGPLKEQSEKAEEFLTLSAERKSLEVTLYCDTIERSKRSVHDQEDKIEAAKHDYVEIEGRLSGIDALFQKNYERNVELIGITNEANKEINEITEEITVLERTLATIASDIAHSDEQVAALRGDKESLSSASGEIDEKIEARKAEIELQKQALLAIEERIGETERQLLELANEGAASDQKRQGIAEELAKLSSELTELRVSSVSKKSESDALLERVETVRQALPELQGKERELLEKQKELKKALLEQDEQIKDNQNRQNGYSIKYNNRLERLEKLTVDLEKMQGESNEANHRITALEEMEKSMDGFAQSVKRILEASQSRNLRGVVGTVSSLISIESGCEIAIETALGNNLQNIVVEDEQAAKDAIRFLREERAGRATFLPLDTVRPSPFDKGQVLSTGGVIGLASSLVHYDKKYENIISNLLGRIVVVEDLDAASIVAKKMDFHHRVVTKDGQLINAGGSYTGGFLARSVGVFSRRNEIDRLQKELGKLKESIEKTAPELDRVKQETVELDAELTVLGSEMINLTTDRVRIESELRYLGSEAENASRAVSAAENEIALSGERAEKLREEASVAMAALGVVELSIAALESSETDALAVGGEFMERRSRLTEQLSEQKVERMEKVKDIENLDAGLQALDAQKNNELGRAGNIEFTIGEIEKLNEARKQEHTEKEQELLTKRDRILTLRNDIDNAVNERMTLDKQNNDMREGQNDETKAREDIAKEISRLEERKIALQKDYDNAVTRLWEDYELTRAEAQEIAVEFTSISALRQSVGQLRNRIRALGTVYVGAIEEYKEVSERYVFLKDQVEDVELSKKQLITLIDSLTVEMRTLFIKSFEEINRHFGSVFVEMFSGGSASLSLSDESDVLESGIEIDVQPPGKLIKNLASLSGGEQSLVAIALYFAILKVNPAPFCVLDEIDSALDEINVSRFAGYLSRLVENTQIISITHRRGTMEAADVLYGVTMQEEGVSKVLKLSINEARLVVSN